MTTDSTGLEGRIARVLHEHWVAEPAGGTATEAWTDCTCGIRISVPGGTRDEASRRGEAHQAEQIAAEVRRGKADAWDEGFEVGESNGYAIGRDIDTDESTENPYREQED